MNQKDSTITTAVYASSDLHLATELARSKYENGKHIEELAHDAFVQARKAFETASQVRAEREKEYNNALRAELAAKK